MRLTLVALGVSFAAAACASTSPEQSLADGPDWVYRTPASRDSVFFTGRCTDAATFQSGYECAREAAFADLSAWLGAEVSSSLRSVASADDRQDLTSFALVSRFFLEQARSEEVFHASNPGGGGETHSVAVLVSYPLKAAESERWRIADATRQFEALVSDLTQRTNALPAQGSWGAMMEEVVLAARAIADSPDLERGRHLRELGALASQLAGGLTLGVTDAEREAVRATVRYQGRLASEVPLEFVVEGASYSTLTDSTGAAVFSLPDIRGPRLDTVRVRPDVRRYTLHLTGAEGSGILEAVSKLADRTADIEVDRRLEVEVSVASNADCGPAVEAAREEFRRATSGAGSGAMASVDCSVTEARGDALNRVDASGRIVLDNQGFDTVLPRTSADASASGLGADATAATREALRNLGVRLVQRLVDPEGNGGREP